MKSILKLFKNINLIEKKIGRIKTKKNDPRVIDIDIIDFNGLIKNSNRSYFTTSKSTFKKFCFISNIRN